MLSALLTLAQADEITMSGAAAVNASYNDNLLMNEDRVGGWYARAEASARFRWAADQALSIGVEPRIASSRYQDRPDLDHTQRYLTMALQSSAEKTGQNLTLSGLEDSTLTSELGVTGLAAVNKTHRSASAVYATNHFFSPSLEGALQLSSSIDRYLDAVGTGLIDYQYSTGSATINYKLSDRSAALIQVGAGVLLVPNQSNLIAGNDYDKKDFDVMIGLTHSITPQWKASISAGPSQVRSSQSVDKGSAYNAALTHTSESMTMNLQLGRDVTPNGYGVLSRRSQVKFDVNKTINEKLSSGISLVSVRNNYLKTDNDKAVVAVDYREINGNIRWAFYQTWSLAFSAGYAWQDQGTREAKRNFASLAISWKGLDQRLN